LLEWCGACRALFHLRALVDTAALPPTLQHPAALVAIAAEAGMGVAVAQSGEPYILCRSYSGVCTLERECRHLDAKAMERFCKE
jgi:hypothetical protein